MQVQLALAGINEHRSGSQLHSRWATRRPLEARNNVRHRYRFTSTQRHRASLTRQLCYHSVYASRKHYLTDRTLMRIVFGKGRIARSAVLCFSLVCFTRTAGSRCAAPITMSRCGRSLAHSNITSRLVMPTAVRLRYPMPGRSDKRPEIVGLGR